VEGVDASTAVRSAGLRSCVWLGTAVDPERAAKGESLYADYCSTCHGFELKNTGGVTFDLRRLRPADHERFVSSVLNGKSQMPPWRGVLDVEQIESIWAFIRATVDR
jgi:mono/diheme cytochrome c family protein